MVTLTQLISHIAARPPRHHAIFRLANDAPAAIKAIQKNIIPNPIQGTSIDNDLPLIT